MGGTKPIRARLTRSSRLLGFGDQTCYKLGDKRTTFQLHIGAHNSNFILTGSKVVPFQLHIGVHNSIFILTGAKVVPFFQLEW